jgi:hypothetical protein
MKIITKSSAVKINNAYKTIVEIFADSLSDVTPADENWAVGSLAFIVKDSTTATGKIYALTSLGEWVEQ